MVLEEASPEWQCGVWASRDRVHTAVKLENALCLASTVDASEDMSCHIREQPSPINMDGEQSGAIVVGSLR
jgi:hypothetical protein